MEMESLYPNPLEAPLSAPTTIATLLQCLETWCLVSWWEWKPSPPLLVFLWLPWLEGMIRNLIRTPRKRWHYCYKYSQVWNQTLLEPWNGIFIFKGVVVTILYIKIHNLCEIGSLVMIAQSPDRFIASDITWYLKSSLLRGKSLFQVVKGWILVPITEIRRWN